LDGTDVAIANATLAAVNFVQQDPFFANDDLAAQVAVEGVSFFSGENCDVPNPSSADASCIQVTVIPRAIDVTFALAIGAADEAETAATATAESVYVACAVQPLFMCNPHEALAGGGEIQLSPGDMINLKPKQGNDKYAPGNFGLLDPPNAENGGAKPIAVNLAQSAPDFCYVNSLGVHTGGVAGPVDDGFNTRFDIFANSINNPINAELRIPPGPNNLKGKIPKNGECVGANATDIPFGRLPRDPCFETDTCDGTNGTIGTGGWDATAYWQTHHGTELPEDFSTRFEVYMAQIGLNADGTSSGDSYPLIGLETPMGPSCAPSKGIAGVGSWERRIIYAAVINCIEHEDDLNGNSGEPIGSAKIVKMFLTEPSIQGEIWAEFLELITPDDDDGKLHHIVQLVRDYER
jgi:hypothetical protein